MNGGRQVGLWTAAMTGSLALHGAVGMALIAMPMPEARPKVETEITIETLAEGSVTTTAPVAEAKVASPVEAVAATGTSVVTIVANASIPVEGQSVPEGLIPVATTQEIAPSAVAATVVAAAAEPIVAPGATPLPVAPVVSEDTSVAAETVALAPAADLQPATLAIEDFAALDALESLPAPTEPLPSVVAPSTSAPDPVASAVVAAPVETSQTVAAPQPVRPPAATSVVIPRIVESAATAVIDPAAKAVTAPLAPAAPVAANPSAKAPVAPPAPARPGVQSISPTSTQPRATVAAPVAVASSPAPAPTGAQPAPAGSSSVVAAPVASRLVTGTSSAPAPVQAQEVVAMLPRPEVGLGEPGDTVAQLANFLDAHETGGCVLAVPSVAQDGEATIDGFSVEDSEVDRIGQAFQRQSGLAVRTHTRHVTAGQCSALAFSRALPQYPNYPLSLRLEAPLIQSGAVLSGEVSGLRKPYLYLVVIDDEGKAKLINTFEGMTKTSVAFSAPMTLTAGPVASVQLLVAVASDDPLTTIATRDGVPAEQFFDGVTGEIINQNRRIHYGITSFIVQ